MKTVFLLLTLSFNSYAFSDDTINQENTKSVTRRASPVNNRHFFKNHNYKFKSSKYCRYYFSSEELTGDLEKDYRILKRSGIDVKSFPKNATLLIPYNAIVGVKSVDMGSFTCLFFWTPHEDESYAVEGTIEDYLKQKEKIETERKQEYIEYIKLSQ